MYYTSLVFVVLFGILFDRSDSLQVFNCTEKSGGKFENATEVWDIQKGNKCIYFSNYNAWGGMFRFCIIYFEH